MNWGVPNWRDADAYPKPDELTHLEWRWEFLRRREDYREDWQIWSKLTIERCHKHQKLGIEQDRRFLSIDHPRFVARNPTINTGPNFTLKYGVRIGLQDPEGRRPMPGLFFKTFGSALVDAAPGTIKQFAKEGEIPIWFDLKLPIKQQLESAGQLLKDLQTEKFGTAKQRRRHIDKWPLYLRVVDARDAGETWESIGTALMLPDPGNGGEALTHLDPDQADRIIDKSGTAIAVRCKQVWDQACELMFNFPP